MRMKLIIALLLTASPALADVTGPGGKTQDCYCTDSSGGRVELEETICLFVDGRAFMARCEMSLNNPMWRPTGDGCLSSKLPQSRQPAGDADPVHPKI
ncbi:hypothetical protein [Actibacterium sp. D379-3]